MFWYVRYFCKITFVQDLKFETKKIHKKNRLNSILYKNLLVLALDLYKCYSYFRR